jgi:hypothetical protein
MDGREILEEKSRAMKKREQRTVMISGQGVNAGLDIGEILQKQSRHFGVDSAAVRHWPIDRAGRSRLCTVAAPRSLRKSAHHKSVPNIPSNARQLGHAIGHSGDKGR